jgi:hypothetical protein
VCVFGVGKEREATASPLASWQRRLYRANRVAGGGDLLEGLSASRRPSALFFLLGLGVGSCPRPRVRPLHVSRDARGRRTRGSFFLPLAWGGGAAGCVPCACAESCLLLFPGFTHDFWEISRRGLGPSDLPRSRLLERQAAVIVNPVGGRLAAESAKVCVHVVAFFVSR